MILTSNTYDAAVFRDHRPQNMLDSNAFFQYFGQWLSHSTDAKIANLEGLFLLVGLY